MEISLLGTGLLGAAISERLLAYGHRLTMWNRSPKRCMPLLALGKARLWQLAWLSLVPNCSRRRCWAASQKLSPAAYS